MSKVFADRHLYLGASEVAAACGESKYTTQQDLYEEKVLKRGRTPEKRIFQRGHHMEAVTIARLKELGMPITGEQQVFSTKQRLWLRSHVDGIVERYEPWPGTQNIDADGPGVLEVKAPGTRMVEQFKMEGLPTDYICQMQINMFNANVQWGRFAVWDYDEWEPVVFDVPRDDALILSLLGGCDRFWLNHIELREPYTTPEPVQVRVMNGVTSFQLLNDRDAADVAAAISAYDIHKEAEANYKQHRVKLEQMFDGMKLHKIDMDGVENVSSITMSGDSEYTKYDPTGAIQFIKLLEILWDSDQGEAMAEAFENFANEDVDFISKAVRRGGVRINKKRS